MSDKYTEVSTSRGAGLGLWGYVDYDAAVAQTREHYERQRDEAIELLADIDRGDVQVWHMLGPWARKNRREVKQGGAS